MRLCCLVENENDTPDSFDDLKKVQALVLFEGKKVFRALLNIEKIGEEAVLTKKFSCGMIELTETSRNYQLELAYDVEDKLGFIEFNFDKLPEELFEDIIKDC